MERSEKNMRLKNIRIYGFKSFADKVDIQLNSNITAIVGPNGSGKSNIVDAVRWVLGEQSVKSLRGSEAMSDVIFTGSKTREPLKRAEVALVFDNQDLVLHTDFKEVEVKRIIYHTGENEYYLNGSKVRLKDIIDLFIDTGAGVGSFNIISQGSIEEIVKSKPVERRVIFEEAAGVLKYKKRKEEALKKLERTKENIEKVDLVIQEVEQNVEPLKEQSEKAQTYLKYKKELEEKEIAVLKEEVEQFHTKYEQKKETLESLTKELETLQDTGLKKNTGIEKWKVRNLELEEDLQKKNEEILGLTKEIASKQSEQEIALERKKNANLSKEEERILNVKEEVLNLKKHQELVKSEEEAKEQICKTYQEQVSDKSIALTRLQGKFTALERQIREQKNKIYEMRMKQQVLQTSLENNSLLPMAVKSILNHPRLKGIHNTIGRVLEFDSKYATALEVALGASSNFLIVDTAKDAEEAISYLKENHLGRATFFPIDVIESRKLSKRDIEGLENDRGYIGILSDLVSFEEKYRKIIENQLGNILVVQTMQDLDRIGKTCKYRYRVVTLDGELLYSGGSLSGGSLKKEINALKEKQELEKLESTIKKEEKEQKEMETSYTQIEREIEEEKEALKQLEKALQLALEEKNAKEYSKQEISVALEKKMREYERLASFSETSLDTIVMNLMEEIQKLESKKQILEKEIENEKKEKSDLVSMIAEAEQQLRKENSHYKELTNQEKILSIELGKIEIRLDQALKVLNEEYHMTFEVAQQKYPFSMDLEKEKEIVEELKQKILRLGPVNLGSIEEYERVYTRYSFLTSQKEDLEKSSNDLLDVIKHMDEIMVERFKKTFEAISKEFQSVFKKLFKGGEGTLKLTDPMNLLETGIEIVAEPPGKKLANITLLSGGEKTLTAISLLFAILNVKPVPFCILDEIEAALDDANVEQFGRYLEEKQENSEFVLITHKKKTMEYAHTLYGITMQESGVSKIVSVRLEET